MAAHLRALFWLLTLSLALCCVVYPGFLLVIGQMVFRDKAEGSLAFDSGGKAIGSRLIAQPFTGDGFFWPRPSAVSYNGAASGASNWAGNNYLLRDSVARRLGPIVKYRGGPKSGKAAGPDIENWFRADRFGGRPGIVAQWANLHSALAQNWVEADGPNREFVAAWLDRHPDALAAWRKDNPGNAQPAPEDLAVPFFESFSREHPGAFPIAVERKTAEGKNERRIEAVTSGPEIQSTFFDFWRQDNPTADLEPVPADMVTSSGSGLDPDITLKNALYQLDRVAAARAAAVKREPIQVRREIETLLRERTQAPLGGLVGVDLVNVLEINLALDQRYGPGGDSRSR